MERKEFIKKIAIGGSILFVAPTFLDSCAIGDDEIVNSEITVDLTNPEFSALGTIGGYAYKDNIILIRISESEYTALSKICTHQGCTVSYSPVTNQLPCPCHGSLYNISGGVINGPAPKSLKQYSVTVDGNMLIIM